MTIAPKIGIYVLAPWIVVSRDDNGQGKIRNLQILDPMVYSLKFGIREGSLMENLIRFGKRILKIRNLKSNIHTYIHSYVCISIYIYIHTHTQITGILHFIKC